MCVRARVARGLRSAHAPILDGFKLTETADEDGRENTERVGMRAEGGLIE